jgi:hypothetical protein
MPTPTPINTSRARKAWNDAERYRVIWALAEQESWGRPLPQHALAYLAALLDRSLNSVGWQSETFRTMHPDYTGKRMGSARDADMVAEVLAATAPRHAITTLRNALV